MIGFSIAFLAVVFRSVSADVTFGAIERITPAVAAERASKCGLGPATIEYVDELQSRILTVADATSATESQLICLERAVGRAVQVKLPPTVQPRFDAIQDAHESALTREEDRKWLSARGLIDRVPKYNPGTTDERVFTREVETLCGHRARGAFQSQFGFDAISPGWVKRFQISPKPEDVEALKCLMSMTSVAGFKVNFVGDEAHAPTK
jgi:hypothetical protein